MRPHAEAALAFPTGALRPVMCGREKHVREPLGDPVESLDLTDQQYIEQGTGGPFGHCEFGKATFGP